jgi:hypothetical protein
MMKRLRLAVFVGTVLALLFQASPQAVGTATVTTTTLSDIKVTKYSIAWLSDGAGAVSANPFTPRAGTLIQFRFVPDGGGTAPTALYDVTLVDAGGFDLMVAAGADRSATLTQVVRPAAPIIFDGTSTLDLVVANAGAAKGGTVILLFQVQQ